MGGKKGIIYKKGIFPDVFFIWIDYEASIGAKKCRKETKSHRKMD